MVGIECLYIAIKQYSSSNSVFFFFSVFYYLSGKMAPTATVYVILKPFYLRMNESPDI